MVDRFEETVVIADVEFVCVGLALSDRVAVAVVAFVISSLLAPG